MPMTAPPVTGSWTDPRDGVEYQEVFDEDKIVEYTNWLPGFIAAINVGAYDEWIYDIAAACHARHLATAGRASTVRPPRPQIPLNGADR